MKITLEDIAIGALVGTILVTGGAIGIAGYYAMNPDKLTAQADPNPIVASTEIAEPTPVTDTPAEAMASEVPEERSTLSESFWNSEAYIEGTPSETNTAIAPVTADAAEASPLSDMDIESGINNLMDETFSGYTYNIDGAGNITVNYFLDTNAHNPTYTDNGQTENTLSWSVTKASTALAAAGLYNSLGNAGGQSRDVTVNLIDANDNNTLLQYVNGSGVYDSVTINAPQSTQNASSDTEISSQEEQTAIDPSMGRFVVSTSGRGKRYHDTNNPCGPAKSINVSDRKYYDSREAAEADGYTACGICFK